MINFAESNFDDMELAFTSLEEKMNKVLRTGKSIYVQEKDIKKLKEYGIPYINNEDIKESYLPEMSKLKGEELIDYLESYENLVMEKGHSDPDRLANFSAVLLRDYVKNYGEKEVVKAFNDIPPKFFTEIQKEAKDIATNQENHHLDIKAFLDVVPAQLDLVNDYYYEQRNKFITIDGVIKKGISEKKRAERASTLEYMIKYGPFKKPDSESHLLSYFTEKNGKPMYAEWRGDNLQIQKSGREGNVYEVVEPFTLKIATKDKIEIRELNVEDAVFTQDGVITEIEEGYFYPEKFRHSKKFYEVLFSHKDYEEVSAIVKEFDEDCERIFLNDYEAFVKGEYEILDLGEWYEKLMPCLEENEKNIVLNDMKIYIDLIREDISKEYIFGESEAPQSYYINEILYGVLDGKNEGLRMLKCLDHLNDENLKYVIENFDRLTTKENIHSKTLLDKYRSRIEREGKTDRTQNIEVENLQNNCLAFIERNIFDEAIPDLSINLAFYKQLKGTGLNKFTDEEKEAIDVLTNGRSEEFFKKITLSIFPSKDIWDKFFLNTKDDAKFYDKDLKEIWFKNYWIWGNYEGRQWILENCEPEKVPEFLKIFNFDAEDNRRFLANNSRTIKKALMLSESAKSISDIKAPESVKLLASLNAIEMEEAKRAKSELKKWEEMGISREMLEGRW